MHYVYVLNHRKNYYIGYTADIETRRIQHQKIHPGFELVYYEAYAHSKAARLREQRLKLYGSAWRGLRKRILVA